MDCIEDSCWIGKPEGAMNRAPTKCKATQLTMLIRFRKRLERLERFEQLEQVFFEV